MNSTSTRALIAELGDLGDMAQRYFRGDNDKTAAFIVDCSIPFYLAAFGSKMYRYDDVWAEIDKTKFQET